MKKLLRFLTDRRWVPVFLINGGKIKWVLYLIGLVLIIFFVLLLGLAMSEESF